MYVSVRAGWCDDTYAGKIVGLTGNILPEDFAEFERNGADAVLAKPLVKDKLVAILRQLHVIP